jgi:hypothetical protein
LAVADAGCAGAQEIGCFVFGLGALLELARLKKQSAENNKNLVSIRSILINTIQKCGLPRSQKNERY